MATVSILSPQPVTTGQLRPLRVLCAEDAPELRQMLQWTLQRDGHAIETVPNGGPGLELLRADPHYDLVITDHQMPAVDGLAFVHGIRALAYTGKILVYCSRLSETTAAEYTRLRVEKILYKPVSPTELRETLRSLFAD